MSDETFHRRDYIRWERDDGEIRYVYWPSDDHSSLGVQLANEPIPLLHRFNWWHDMISALLFI